MTWNNKYKAKRANYGGNLYHSAKEANYALELDIRIKAGEIKSWRRQVPVKLEMNGKKICTYIVDFVAEYPNGHEQWIEIKGYPNPVGELKVKMFKAQYPGRDYVVIR